MVVRVIWAFLMVSLTGCYVEDGCKNYVDVTLPIKDTLFLTPRSNTVSKVWKSSLGNYQSLVNDWKIWTSNLSMRSDSFVLSDYCRNYKLEYIFGFAQSSIYPFNAQFKYGRLGTSEYQNQLIITLNEGSYFSKINQTFSIVTPVHTNGNLSYCHSLPSGDTCYSLPFIFSPSFTNAFGITHKFVFEISVPPNPSINYKKFWFSGAEGFVGLEYNSGEKWFVFSN